MRRVKAKHEGGDNDRNLMVGDCIYDLRHVDDFATGDCDYSHAKIQKIMIREPSFKRVQGLSVMVYIYTVNHKKRGSLFLTIILADLNRFFTVRAMLTLQVLY